MGKMDDILEDILTDAVEDYLRENQTDILKDINQLVSEGKTLSDALDAVVFDWLACGDGFLYIREDMSDQAERSCDYSYDCERIIFEYGFVNSLEAAKEEGCRLSDVDEYAVASAVLRANLPGKTEIREAVRECMQNRDAFQKLEAEQKNAEVKQAEEAGY